MVISSLKVLIFQEGCKKEKRMGLLLKRVLNTYVIGMSTRLEWFEMPCNYAIAHVIKQLLSMILFTNVKGD